MIKLKCRISVGIFQERQVHLHLPFRFRLAVDGWSYVNIYINDLHAKIAEPLVAVRLKAIFQCDIFVMWITCG
jgi:hypothetical protein